MTIDGSGPPEEAVNWEAYSHDELYRMLWQDADVGDVSVVATEWARHRAALDTHAEVLREQRAVLADSWQGPAADEAAARLDALAGRVEKISELALAGQQAAQDAADALATARAMMPPPPAEQAAMPGAVLPAAFPAVPDYAEMFTPPAVPTAPGMGTAFGAVGGGGFSFYFGSAGVDQQKAQAVQAMQTYESSLVGGSRLIDEARGSIPAAASRAAAEPPAVPGGGGVAWERLAGPAPGRGPVIGGSGGSVGGGGVPGAGRVAPPATSARLGALPPPASGAQAGQLAEQAAARGAGQGGVLSPVGRQGGADDEQHENHLPTIDHGLFTVDAPASVDVISPGTGVRQ